MNGAQELDQLRSAGFSSDAIGQYEAQKRQELSSAGFSQQEVDDYFGQPAPDMSGVAKHFADVAKQVSTPTNGEPRKAASFEDYVKAGWQASVTGLQRRGKLPDVTAEDAPWYGRFVAGSTQMIGDLPEMVGGALAGSVAGTLVAPGPGTIVGAGGGAFALPAALRQALIQNYKKGALKDPQDFVDRALGITQAAGKGFVVGAATAVSGGLAEAAAPFAAPVLNTAAKVAVETATLTETSAALEGHLPTFQEFGDAAIMVGGFHVATGVSNKLMDIYAKTGKRPADVLADMQSNPTIKQDLLASNKDIPDAYAGEKTPDYTAEAAPQGATNWNKMYTDYVNDLHPIYKVVEALGGADAKVGEHAGKLAQLTRGDFGRADAMIEYGPIDFNTYERTGPSLKSAIAPALDEKPAAPTEAEKAILSKVGDGSKGAAAEISGTDRLEAYLLARHSLEAKTETGLDRAAAEQVVKDGGARYSRMADQITQFREGTLKYLADSGILDQKKLAAFREAYKNYVPLYRILGGEETQKGVGPGTQVHNPIKGRIGSDLNIQHPIESIVKDTYTFVALANRNEARLALVKLAEQAPNGGQFVKRVPQSMLPVNVTDTEVAKFLKDHGMDPAKAEAFTIFRPRQQRLLDNQIDVYRDGKRQVYEVNPEVAKAFNGADAQTSSLMVDLLSKPATWLRSGAVLSPDFIGRNPLRDQWSAFIFSREGYKPMMDMLSGMGSLLKKDDAYQEWLKSGGANSALVSVDRQYVEENVLGLMQKTGIAGKVLNTVKSPMEGLRVVSELMENSTRLGEFKRSADGGVAKADVLEAGFKSREITLDFARIGAKMRAMNRLTAFSNAGIQGIDRAARAFKEDPVGTAAKIAASITLPSVLLWWANHDDERYKALPHWQKDMFWIVMTDDHIYRIPKPFELGVTFGTGVERVLDAWVAKDPHAFDQVGSSIASAFSPNVVPTFALPPLEQWANKSWLTGNPIIPGYLENLLPEYQYTPYTSELTKAIGQLVGAFPGMHDSQAASPAVIDNYIRGWSGGLGVYAVQLADAALRKAGALPDPTKPADTLADIPFVKAFTVRYPTAAAQPVQDFYARFNDNLRVLNTVQTMAKEGDIDAVQKEMRLAPDAMVKLTGIRDSLSNASKMVRMVYKNPAMSADDKRQVIDSVYYQMIEMARQGNAIMDTVTETLGQNVAQPTTH